MPVSIAYTLPVHGTSADFSISANQTSLTVQQSYPLTGSTVSTDINIASVNGFAGTVALSDSAPTGFTVSFSPSSFNVASGGLSQSTIAVSSTVSGSYNVTVTGTSGSIVHSIQIAVTVTVPPPDFSLSANPISMILAAGSSGTSTLSLKSFFSFSGPVTLTVCVNVPNPPCPILSVTGSANPPIVTLTSGSTATATVTINTATITPTTTYDIWIDATGGGLIHQAVISVGVGPYFTMSASPNALTVPAGSARSSTLALTSFVNFTFTANFQIGVYLPGPNCPPYCPVYPTVSIIPTTVNLPAFGTGTATLTVSTTPATTQGIYTINLYGGGCVCILPVTTITVNVTSPPPNNFSQDLLFDGVIVYMRGNFSITTSSISGNVSLSATNLTSGGLIFSKTFNVAFSFGSASSPRFILVIPVKPYTLGATCIVDSASNQVNCFLSRDPDTDRKGTVDIIDVSMIALAFGSFTGSSKYDPILDLTAQGTVNIIDVGIVAADYGAPIFS